MLDSLSGITGNLFRSGGANPSGTQSGSNFIGALNGAQPAGTGQLGAPTLQPGEMEALRAATPGLEMLERSAAPAPNALGGSTYAPARVAPAGSGSAPSFGEVLERFVDNVDSVQKKGQAAGQAILSGESDNLHQSVIAMQESSVAFTLMVEVRNKLIESYQELMRLQV